jgi:hypothetical protein
VGEEGGFPFITFFDPDIVEAPADIHFCEEGTAAHSVNNSWNEWGYVSVVDSPFVDRPVVLYGVKLSIPLLYKEEVGGVGAPGFTDGSSSQVFFDEFVHFLDFFLCKGEESSGQSPWCFWYEFDSVVPYSMFQ